MDTGVLLFKSLCLHVGTELSLDHIGPMARTVSDVALLLEAIAGYDDGRDQRQFPNMAIPKYSQLVSEVI